MKTLGLAALVMMGIVGCASNDDVAAIDAAVIDAPAVDAPPIDAMTDASFVDAPIVDAPIDAPTSAACDPLAVPGQQGCAAGQKCTWIDVQDVPENLGVLGCVPDGTVAITGACVHGPVGETTGYDDCTAGLICVGGTCQDICGFDGSTNAACGANSHCVRYDGLFSNGSDPPFAGVCNPACDPVTQLQSSGATCGANRGCYLLVSQDETIAICASAGNLGHGQEIVGGAFANSCVPGAQPRPRPGTTSVECGGLCRPADVTSTTNMASEGGVGADSCATRWGAAPPGTVATGESCRYWRAREPHAGLSPYSNTVGWCFKHAAFFYDSDLNGSDDMPFPRCINLTTGDMVPPISNPPHNDAQYFWCVAAPAMFIGSSTPAPRAPEPRFERLAPQ